MRFGELKRQAKGYMFAPRRPNLFLVSILYLFLVFLLMAPVENLSEIGRFQAEVAANTQTMMQNVFRDGGPFVVERPTFSLTFFGLIFFVIPWVFRWVLELGYLYYARGIVNEEPQGYRSLFEGFHFFRKAILIRMIQALMYWGGLMLFVAPGIWAFCAFSQANLLLLNHPDRGALWCLRESRRLMAGHKLEYFLLVLSFLGWRLITIIPFPVLSITALLWYLPYSTLTYVGYYNKLTGQGTDGGKWQRPGMF